MSIRITVLVFLVLLAMGCDNVYRSTEDNQTYTYMGFSSNGKLEEDLVERILMVYPTIDGTETDIYLTSIASAKSDYHDGPCPKHFTGQQVKIWKRVGMYCKELLYDVWVCGIPICYEAGLKYVRTLKSFVGPCPY